jgi:phosphatidylglycerol:prolipoprotein diacylglycerol transferase
MLLYPDIDPVAIRLGPLAVHWYGLMYAVGFLAGWWLGRVRARRPGSPLTPAQVDDFLIYAALGVVLGGRIGYVLFYNFSAFLENPLLLIKLWEGGMSFHGGVIGVSLGIIWLARKNSLDWLRLHDYVACCVPFGLFFGRLANFVNGELWGRVTDVPWAVIFPGEYAAGLPRHPSQLYEASLEGILLFIVLATMFWKTDARYQPGKLVGTFLVGYGFSRFFVEFFREPDVQLGTLSWGLTMGQTLTLPMIIGGTYLIATAKGRRRRVEPIAGAGSIA